MKEWIVGSLFVLAVLAIAAGGIAWEVVKVLAVFHYLTHSCSL